MSVSFRKELIDFLVTASQRHESYYGYINPYLLSEIVGALSSTGTGLEDELESLSDWADEYWGW